MSSVASASLLSGTRVEPGALFRLCALAGAAAVGLVVVSAVLELGTTHWGIALVALPLLVANVVLARLAYPRALCARTVSRSRRSSSRSRSGASSPGAATRPGRPRCTSERQPWRSDSRSSSSPARFRGEATPLAVARATTSR